MRVTDQVLLVGHVRCRPLARSTENCYEPAGRCIVDLSKKCELT